MNNLRIAIKPQPLPPKHAGLYLPEKFQEAKPSPREEGVVIEVTNSVVEEDEWEEGIRVVSGNRKGDGQKKLGGSDGEEKVLSAVERRRKIKDALMEGSEEKGFKGYHRRMW